MFVPELLVLVAALSGHLAVPTAGQLALLFLLLVVHLVVQRRTDEPEKYEEYYAPTKEEAKDAAILDAVVVTWLDRLAVLLLVLVYVGNRPVVRYVAAKKIRIRGVAWQLLPKSCDLAVHLSVLLAVDLLSSLLTRLA